MAVSIYITFDENSQSVTSNKTNVTAAVVAKWTGGSFNLNKKSGWLKINGTSYSFTNSFNDKQTTSGTKVLFTKTVDIVHDNDGTKEDVPVSASYTSGVSSGTVTASMLVDLTTIDRESTLGASDANIGSKSTIVVDRKNKDFTHSIAYKFGSLTGYIKADGSLSTTEVKLTAVSISWTVPTTFYGQIPKAKTGTCTLTIKTYSGNTQIGAAKTDTLTVTAAQALCAPIVSGTVADINDATVALTGDDSKLVRYMSVAYCAITATAKNSATIASKKIAGVAVTDDATEISGIRTSSVDFYAKDSRGYESAVSVPVELVPYIVLTNKASGARDDPTSGNVTLTVKGNYYNGSFGAEDNALSIRYSIDGSDPIEATPTINGNTYSATLALTGLDYQSAFEISVTVSDKLDSKTEIVSIGKGVPIYYHNENKFVFCVPVSMADTIKTGILKITPTAADTPTVGEVVFDTPFPGAPIVSLTAVSSVPGTQLKGISLLGVTTTGFKAYLTRSNLVETWIHWQAIYQPEVSAAAVMLADESDYLG